jgi:ribosome-binding protein aMBF1 (putative translation factor)
MKDNCRTLDQFIEDHYGEVGTSERDEFEKGFEAFRIGHLIQKARIEKGLSQEELAIRCGTNRAYISRIENSLQEIRFSTLQRIVEIGLEGHLDISIRL